MQNVNLAFSSFLVTFSGEQSTYSNVAVREPTRLRNERFKDLRGIPRPLTVQLNIFLCLGKHLALRKLQCSNVHSSPAENHPCDRSYFLWAVPLAVPQDLFPERRTGTLDTGILVRAGGGGCVFGGVDSASRTDDRADWLAE